MKLEILNTLQKFLSTHTSPICTIIVDISTRNSMHDVGVEKNYWSVFRICHIKYILSGDGKKDGLEMLVHRKPL